MGLDRHSVSQYHAPKYKEVDAAYQMQPTDLIVRARANTASDSYEIVLPSVSEAAGNWYSILAHIANSKAVTVTHKDDSEQWDGDAVLDTDGDRILLYSDSMSWHRVTSIT